MHNEMRRKDRAEKEAAKKKKAAKPKKGQKKVKMSKEDQDRKYKDARKKRIKTLQRAYRDAEDVLGQYFSFVF